MATKRVCLSSPSYLILECSTSSCSPSLQRPPVLCCKQAGTGLFLRGEAKPGAVVAIFPGVVYGRTQLTHMPNYPKVRAGVSSVARNGVCPVSYLRDCFWDWRRTGPQ